MINLTENERDRIKNINQDKVLVEGLKKVFLNCFLEGDVPKEVNVLAAQSLAIEFLRGGFKELAKIKDEETLDEKMENIV